MLIWVVKFCLIIKDDELTGLTTFINGSGETVVVSGATAGIQTGDFITDDLDIRVYIPSWCWNLCYRSWNYNV